MSRNIFREGARVAGIVVVAILVLGLGLLALFMLLFCVLYAIGEATGAGGRSLAPFGPVAMMLLGAAIIAGEIRRQRRESGGEL